MRGLRFLPVLATVACAELSGLTDLVVDGSASVDASTDVAIDDSGAESGTQEAGGASDAASSYCLGLAPSAYTFCADFDEGDVTKGYAMGAPLPWSIVTQSPPTLTMASPVSMPAAAAFVGSSHQALAYMSSSIQTFSSMNAQVRVDIASGNSTSQIVVLQLASDYALVLSLADTFNNVQAFTADLDEVHLAPDGGTISTVSHPFASSSSTSYALGAWHTFTLTLGTTLSATFDKNTLSFTPPQLTTSSNITIALNDSTTGWAGSFDNVYFSLK